MHGMIPALVGVVVVLITALAWTLVRHAGAVLRYKAEKEAAESVEIPPDYGPDITQIKAELSQLYQAVAEGINHAERVERRVKAVVQRARKELASEGLEHDGLEAEASELRLIDGGGGPGGGMLQMPEDVGDVESSVPGVTQDQLRRVRGR